MTLTFFVLFDTFRPSMYHLSFIQLTLKKKKKNFAKRGRWSEKGVGGNG